MLAAGPKPENLPKASLLIFAAVAVFSLLPHTACGEIIEVITARGNVFVMDIRSAPSDPANHAGASSLDGLGSGLRLAVVELSAQTIYGSGTNSGKSATTRPHTYTDGASDYAATVLDSDRAVLVAVPEFAAEYQYGGGGGGVLSRIPVDVANILGYSEAVDLDGSSSSSSENTKAITGSGITITGGGTTVLKLDDYGGETYLLRSHVQGNGTVRLVESQYDLTGAYVEGKGFEIASIESEEINIRGSSRSGSYLSVNLESGGQLDAYASSIENIVTENDLQADYRNYCKFERRNTAYDRVLRFDSVMPVGSANAQSGLYDLDGISAITEQRNWCARIPHLQVRGMALLPDTLTGSVQVYDRGLPALDAVQLYDGYGRLFTFPEDDLYIIAEPGGGTITVSAEAHDPAADVFFRVGGLYPNKAYEIEKNGIISARGVTSDAGRVVLPASDVDFGYANSAGGLLKIYPSSVAHRGPFSAVMLDTVNGAKKMLPSYASAQVVYSPFAYLRLASPAAFELEAVDVNSVQLDYLLGTYAVRESLMIPVLPGMGDVSMRINGQDIVVQLEDVASSGNAVKPIPEKHSLVSDHKRNGSVAVSSDVASTAFVIAPQTGTMYAIVDATISGAGEISIDAQYAGGFSEEVRTCVWKGASSPYRTRLCGWSSYPLEPASVRGMEPLSSGYQAEIADALNRGAVRGLTAYVDVMVNGQALYSEVIHRASVADATVPTSPLSEKYALNKAVRFEYFPEAVSKIVRIDVAAGDMVEFVARANLETAGIPAAPDPRIAVDISAYAQARTAFHGGSIITGMN